MYNPRRRHLRYRSPVREHETVQARNHPRVPHDPHAASRYGLGWGSAHQSASRLNPAKGLPLGTCHQGCHVERAAHAGPAAADAAASAPLARLACPTGASMAPGRTGRRSAAGRACRVRAARPAACATPPVRRRARSAAGPARPPRSGSREPRRRSRGRDRRARSRGPRSAAGSSWRSCGWACDAECRARHPACR